MSRLLADETCGGAETSRACYRNMMTTCTGVEMFKKLLDRGEAGDNVGTLLRGIKREEVQHPCVSPPHTPELNR